MGRRPTRATTKEMEGIERNARVLYNPSVLSLLPSTNSRDHVAWIRRRELKRRLCSCLCSSQTRGWSYPGIRMFEVTEWIAKRNLTIPRLELISGYMTVNLATNVQQVLTTHPATVHCWLDSSVALYCIVLYCIVLYCIVLYCIVLYCIVLYCIVLYCIVLY